MKIKEVASRLQQFCDAISPTQAEFATKLHISPQGLQRYLSGIRAPGSEVLSKLSSLGCNLNWLLIGTGEMASEVKTFKPRTKAVPVLAEVDCGIPIHTQIIEEGVKYVDMFDTSGLRNPFLVIARGDSMVPYINNGDMLLCSDDEEKIKTGKAVIVSYRTTPETYQANAKLVRFQKDDSILLYSVNTKYPPTTYLKSEIFKMFKVVRIIREVR
ncbi:hypothetical protein BH10BAC5_BH10BAC5_25950 [soil metagenome]